MLDTIAQIALKISHTEFFVILLIIGLFTRLRDDVMRIVPLLLMSIFLNGVLKKLIAKPLPVHIDPHGFALPSGHMQSVALLWTYFAIQLRQVNIFPLLAIFFIPAVGWALIHQGYHEPIDVIAGILVGSGLSIFYIYLLYTKRWENQFQSAALIMALLSSCLYFSTQMDAFKRIMLGISWLWFAGVYIYMRTAYAYKRTKA